MDAGAGDARELHGDPLQILSRLLEQELPRCRHIELDAQLSLTNNLRRLTRGATLVACSRARRYS